MPGRARVKGTAKNNRGSRREAGPRKEETSRVHLVRTSNYQGPRAEQSGYREPGKKGQERNLEADFLQQYLEPNIDRERELQERKKKIMESKARKELNRRTLKEAAASRVSYVKKPFARRSRISFLLTAASLVLGGTGIYQGVVTQGHASITYGAMGLCSIFLSSIAILYGGFSFREEDKNYILAKLGIGVSVVMLAGWAVVIIVGLGD